MKSVIINKETVPPLMWHFAHATLLQYVKLYCLCQTTSQMSAFFWEEKSIFFKPF